MDDHRHFLFWMWRDFRSLCGKGDWNKRDGTFTDEASQVRCDDCLVIIARLRVVRAGPIADVIARYFGDDEHKVADAFWNFDNCTQVPTEQVNLFHLGRLVAAMHMPEQYRRVVLAMLRKAPQTAVEADRGLAEAAVAEGVQAPHRPAWMSPNARPLALQQPPSHPTTLGKVWVGETKPPPERAAAERALRQAERDLAIRMTDRGICGYLALDDACQDARRKLSALGGEP